MVNIWTFIPRKRIVNDPNDYSKPFLEEDEKQVQFENNPDWLKLDDGQYVKIHEYRDEATRPWWRFFDEFEYRETTRESKRYKWFEWYEEGTTKAEKKLLWKLDFCIAFYAFIGYWVKYIDTQNINNAYVSNMKEDLNMKGNDLINTQTLFQASSVIFSLPSMFLLPRVPTNYLLFTIELCWSLFTIGLHSITNVSQLQALRWFVGGFEALYFPTIHWLLASWYKPSEVSRRGALFYMGQFLGVLTSGLICGAAFDNLNNKQGLAGWAWMYVIDGSLSAFVAVLALFVVPGTPFNCYSLWLTDEEIIMARQRMHKNGTDTSDTVKAFFDKSTWKKVFSSWQIYLISFINMMGFNTNNTSSGSFTLWLKALDKWDIGEINRLGCIPPGLGMVYIIIICFGADLTRKRFLFIMLSFVMCFLSNIILAIWDVPYAAKWFAFCSGYWSWSQSSVFNPLISDFFRKDNSVRAIAFEIIYVIGNQASVWIGRLVWPTVDSPRFHKGFSTCAAFSLGFNAFLAIAYFLYKRDERRDALLNGIYLYNSKTESIPEGAVKTVESASKKSSSSIEYHEDKVSDSK